VTALRVPLFGLAEGVVELTGDDARYVTAVHRLRAGQNFVLFDPAEATEADATIVSANRGSVCCKVGRPRSSSCVANSPAWLLLGVCKGDRFEWALREATALGVTDIVPTLCARSASSRTNAQVRADAERVARWRRIVVQGVRQCGRGDMPRLHSVVGLREAVEMVPESLVRVCLWEGASEPVGRWLRAASSGVVLLVGPEGGLEASEVEVARSGGFAVCSLGAMVLRTETAVVAAIGAWRLMKE